LKNSAAIKLLPLMPALSPEAMKSAGKTAVFKSGNLMSTEIKKPVYAQMITAKSRQSALKSG
jgi:hypothetical protein